MAKPGSDKDGAMVDKQAGKKVCKHRHRIALKTTLWNKFILLLCPPMLNKYNEVLLDRAS